MKKTGVKKSTWGKCQQSPQARRPISSRLREEVWYAPPRQNFHLLKVKLKSQLEINWEKK
jgi:hypothetical protein